MEHSYGPNHSSLFLLTAAMISDTQRRRTSLNARVARRRILLAFETSWTLLFQLTLESNASNRKRRKPVKLSAKTRRALAEGFQRQKPRKRNVVQRRKPRRRRKLRRSIFCAVQSVLFLQMIYIGCKSRGKEGEGCSCQCREEGTPRRES